MTDVTTWISAVRLSHDHLVALTAPLTDDQVRAQSFATEWTIADVASHLGSQAEIFGLFLDSGLASNPAPGGEVFGPIWDRWNNTAPLQQVADSARTNEAFVTRVEGLSLEAREAFTISMFGSDADLTTLLAMRLGEHALHTWDVAVALDPATELLPAATDLLIDTIGSTAGRAGKPVEGSGPLSITTSSPSRNLILTLDPAVSLTATEEEAATADLGLTAAQLIRLVSGRLRSTETGSVHTPESGNDTLATVKSAFPGF